MDINDIELRHHYGISRELYTLMSDHIAFILKANETTNLTRITSFSDALVYHLEDSLSAVPLIHQAPSGLLGDLGSGAGFPGIPLALATGRQTTLIESVKKKAQLLEQWVTSASLENVISIYPGRAEELAELQRASFAIITARAVSQLGSLMELASPLLIPGGMLICYKGKPEAAELEHAHQVGKIVGMAIESRLDYVLHDPTDNAETHHCLIIVKKTGNPQIKLPRRNGMAQKKPL